MSTIGSPDIVVLFYSYIEFMNTCGNKSVTDRDSAKHNNIGKNKQKAGGGQAFGRDV